ncbi:PAS domain S-box protein [Methanocalculus taiwanensis]|uniref:histidine kinase n=1 Tax=Methanocalculus taiwanensis TaxID=106207 RepID=A0ABD4TKS4_9EURY|nr:PAS domain S-box protein [Methanocalculus taiwanensis]MCQ1538794.1 PAS domain S-box protein [Methanocalculus taiwanensis]
MRKESTISNEFYAFSDAMPGGICVIDHEKRILVWNRTLAGWSGSSAEEMINRNLLEAFPHLASPAYRIRIEQVLEGGPPAIFSSQLHRFFLPFTTNDGTPRIQQTSVIGHPGREGEPLHAMIIIEDVTELDREIHSARKLRDLALREVQERKKVEKELRKSEKSYHAIYDQSPIGIEIYTAEGRLAHVNFACLKLFGIETAEEVLNFSLFDDPNVGDEEKKRLRAGESVRYQVLFDFERVKAHNLYRTSRSGTIWLDVLITPLQDPEEGTMGYLVQIMDISERKDAEEALERSRNRYRSLVANVPSVLFRCLPDEGWTMIYMNTRIEEISGYPYTDFIRNSIRTYESIIHPDDRRYVHDSITRSLSAGEQWDIQYRIIHRDGGIRWVQERGRLFSPDSMTRYLDGFIFDITSRKKAEEALVIVNKKLQLLSGITRHDILNQIMILNGFLSFAEKEAEGNQELLLRLEKIHRASDMIQRQIEFTRMYDNLGTKKPAWMNVREMIEGVLADQIPIRQNCGRYQVLADPMIEKVFSNLMENTIRYAKGATGITMQCEEHDDMLVITWEDDGPGIPDEQKEKIFQRGFGRNTGLGLFFSREILSITGISITETGIYGEGARFEIRVPGGVWRRFVEETK